MLAEVGIVILNALKINQPISLLTVTQPIVVLFHISIIALTFPINDLRMEVLAYTRDTIVGVHVWVCADAAAIVL